MSNDSSAAGYLTPSASDPYDDALDDILSAAIVGITGIDQSLVRPRWTPEPGALPAFNVNWVAFGITRRPTDDYAYIGHNPADNSGNGSSTVEMDEELQTLHSFYGPAASANCEQFRRGLQLEQNRATLRSNGVALTHVEEAVVVPALLQNIWVKRVDVNVIYRRRTATTYTILTVESGALGLNNEVYVTPITITGP